MFKANLLNSEVVEDMRQRTSFITLLSVVSSIAVVFLHTNSCFWAFSTERYWFRANIIECVFYFAVPCFFMISGATLIDYRERCSLKEYLVKRVRKTVIPFIAWSLIALAFRIFYKHTVSLSELSPRFIFNGIMGCSFMDIYWFFPNLFGVYLCIPLFAAVDKNNRREVFSFLVIAGFIFNSLLPLANDLFGLGLNLPIYVTVISGSIFHSVIGYLLYTTDLSKSQRTVIYILAIAGVLLHIIGTYVLSTNAGTVISTFKGYQNVPALLQAAGVFVWFKYNGDKLMKHRPVNAVVTFLSAYTFGLYLVHYYLKDIMLSEFPINSTSAYFSLGAPFIIIPISIGIIWLLKKIPVIRHIVP